MSSYIPIASQTISSNTASVVFNSIPSTLNGKTLRDLVIVSQYKTNSAAVMTLRRTGDSGGAIIYMEGDGVTRQARTSTTGPLELQYAIFSGSTLDMSSIIRIFDFALDDRHKAVFHRYGVTGMSYPGSGVATGKLPTYSIITSLTIAFGGGQQFLSGSTISLFGIEG